MSLIFNLPENPLDLVRDHWLIERLGEMDLSPDPVMIRKIFTATAPQTILIHNAFKEEKSLQSAGRRIIAAYEKAIAAFQKLTDDPKIYDKAKDFLKVEVERLEANKLFQERAHWLIPPQVNPAFSTIQQTVSQQAYLLTKILKPLAASYNAGGREITDSKIHDFIADLLAAVYKDHFQADKLNPGKIKGMVKDIRTTSSKKKLAELHRIIK